MPSALARAARSRAESVLSRIQTRKDDIARAFYDVGSDLAELRDKRLYGSLGYATFDAMLEDRGVMSPQYARRLIQVVKAFDRDQAKRLGPEKAYALARYVARTAQDDDPAEYIAEGFPVPGGRRRPIDEVSVRDIANATRLAVFRQKGGHGVSERARRDAASAAKHVAARLRPRTDAQAEVRHVFRKGSWWLEVLVPAEMASAVR
jgi:hypothetical protein